MRAMATTPASPGHDEEFYTVPEAAEILAVSEATIWRWIVAKRLRAYRIGPRRIRIRRQDLAAVVQPVEPKEATMAGEGEGGGIWAQYDPERVRQALRKSAGALAGVDRRTLSADIHAARKQSSHGRPA